jgi:3',5'-cyclic AMP phosphodiesterase CpdA
VKILHLSDTHIQGAETIASVDPTQRLSRVLGEIIDRRLGVDCCVITGDLAHLGAVESYEALRSILHSCPFPVHVVPGNHDDIRSAAAVLSPWYWPEDDVWAWKHDDFSVVGVVSAVPGYHHGALSSDQVRKLRDVAAKASQEGPWVLALHHPPVDVGHWWMDAQGLLEGRDELLEVADQFGAAAILCGHLHLTALVHRAGGTPVLVAPSVAHEVVYDDGPSRPLRFRAGTPRALLHSIDRDGVTTVELTFGGSSELAEGRPWVEEARRADERGPSIK